MNANKTNKALTLGLPAIAAIATGLFAYKATRAKSLKNARPVSRFSIERFIGKWYVIANMEPKQDKNFNNVTAHYSMNEDGTIKIRNKGFDSVKNNWIRKDGLAKFTKDKSIGKFKTTFFKPIWTTYSIIALEENYNYALIAGTTTDTLWLFSRQPQMPNAVINDFLSLAATLGYDTTKLHWVLHNPISV